MENALLKNCRTKLNGEGERSMEFWIARDSNDDLFCYYDKPKKLDYSFGGAQSAILARTLFPEVTFENSPQRVELKLVEE